MTQTLRPHLKSFKTQHSPSLRALVSATTRGRIHPETVASAPFCCFNWLGRYLSRLGAKSSFPTFPKRSFTRGPHISHPAQGNPKGSFFPVGFKSHLTALRCFATSPGHHITPDTPGTDLCYSSPDPDATEPLVAIPRAPTTASLCQSRDSSSGAEQARKAGEPHKICRRGANPWNH